tara:strand:+ start:354 stop:710 length:357 start_codon:yes stop_codon:yes gene_type:complete
MDSAVSRHKEIMEENLANRERQLGQYLYHQRQHMAMMAISNYKEVYANYNTPTSMHEKAIFARNSDTHRNNEIWKLYMDRWEDHKLMHLVYDIIHKSEDEYHMVEQLTALFNGKINEK